MLHTILLVCCLNQFTVSVEKPLQSFTVEVEKPVVAADSKPYVVMFTASWCGLCIGYKDDGRLDKIIKSGIKVRMVDIDADSSYYSGRIPKFWICKDNIRIHEFPEGTIAPDVVVKKVRELDKSNSNKTTTTRNVYNGRPNNSHTNRQTLIDHLMTGEVHRGKHSLSALNNMTDVELDNLHNMDHTTR